MIHNQSINIANLEFERGTTIRGTVCFETDRPRNSRDFSIVVSLKAALHTCIPTASGVQSHSDRALYSCARNVSVDQISRRTKRFQIPFSYAVSSTCPISGSYSNMASIQHHLQCSILDLNTGHEPASDYGVDVRVLSNKTPNGAKAITRTYRKVDYTSSSIVEAGTSHLVQLVFPAKHLIDSYKATLTASVKITDLSKSFDKKTERPLNQTSIISRKAPDGSNISVLGVAIPHQVESSIAVPGFDRSYSMTVFLCFKNKATVKVVYDIVVLNSPSSQGATAVGQKALSHCASIKTPEYKPPSSATSQVPVACSGSAFKRQSTHSKIAISDDEIIDSRPDTKSGPGALRRQWHQAVETRQSGTSAELRTRLEIPVRQLKGLSMAELANESRKITTKCTEMSKSNSTSAISRSASTRSTVTADSNFSMETPSTPRSTTGSFSSWDSSPKSPVSHCSSLSKSSRIESGSASTRTHARKSSSFSFMSKRNSAIQSLNTLTRRWRSPKDLEISCCGPSSLPPPSALAAPLEEDSSWTAFKFPARSEAQSKSETGMSARPETPVDQVSTLYELPDTPGSCYSSMPSSPTIEASLEPSSPRSANRASAIARGLSFKRISRKESPRPDQSLSSLSYDKRFSMSNCYLSGFDFEGLSTLDTDEELEAETSHNMAGSRSDAESLFGRAL